MEWPFRVLERTFRDTERRFQVLEYKISLGDGNFSL